MATTTKQNSQYCTTSPSIDANIGPWDSIDAYITWLSEELGVDTPKEGTEILIKGSTGSMTKYRYEVVSGTASWKVTGSVPVVTNADTLNTTSSFGIYFLASLPRGILTVSWDYSNRITQHLLASCKPVYSNGVIVNNEHVQGVCVLTRYYTSGAWSNWEEVGGSSGGEANVIETVKVNGTALTPSNKAVNITVPTKLSDLQNDLSLTKSDVGLSNVDNTADADKSVASATRATQDASGNVITTTYETKADATTKNYTLTNSITALQTQIEQVMGVKNASFGGIVDASTDIASDYTDKGYSGTYFYMVGTNMSSLVAYEYTGSGDPTVLFSGATYDFTDYSDVKTQVTAISAKCDKIEKVVRPALYQEGASPNYEAYIKEFYLVDMPSGDLNINYYNNKVNLTCPSAGVYAVCTLTDVSNGDVVPIPVSITNDDTNYPIGKIAGYIVFSNLGEFKNHTSTVASSLIVRSVAENKAYSPYIQSKLKEYTLEANVSSLGNRVSTIEGTLPDLVKYMGLKTSISSATIDATNWLLDGAMIPSNASSATFSLTFINNFSCIIFRCKAGDTYVLNNWTGGSGQARPYAFFNTSGTLISNGSGTVSETLTAAQDGYVVFNKTSSNTGTLTLTKIADTNDLRDGYLMMLMQLQSKLQSLQNELDGDVSTINASISSLQTNLQTQIDAIYNASCTETKMSSGVAFSALINTSRTIKDATMTFKANDVLDYVIVPYANKENKLEVHIYDDTNTLEQKYICPYKYSEITNTYKFSIGHKLKAGYSVAFRNVPYTSQSSTDRFYDYANSTYITTYAYWIEFYVKRLSVADNFTTINNTLSTIQTNLSSLATQISNDKRSVNILLLGNSFTQDSISYVPAILKNVAPNLKFTIGVAYIGGCELVQHCANFTGESQTLDGTTFTAENYAYSKFSNTDSAWQSIGSKTAAQLLALEAWDIITLQQNGIAAAKSWATYYEPFIFKTLKAIFDKASTKTFKFGWLLTHGTYISTQEGQLAAWEGTVENTQKIYNLTGTQIIFPYGTAVQNLRTTPLHAAGAGGDNEGFLADAAHLQEGIGTLVANYANALVLLNSVGYDNLSIVGEATRITKEWNTSNATLGPNYGTSDSVKGITDDNVYAAQMAAIMAVKFPYVVTDCTAFYTASE